MALGSLAPSHSLRDMIDNALTYTAKKGLLGPEETLERFRSADPQVAGYVGYSLARDIASHLQEIKAGCKGLYLYGGELSDDPATCPELCLIIRTARNSNALESVAQWLTETVDGEMAQLLGLPEYRYLHLDIVDDAAMLERRGAASLLNSPHRKALPVWVAE